MEQDYAKVLVEQNKIRRRLKIQSIENQISEEKSKKKTNAILTGILTAGVVASVALSGLDMKQALETEAQALTSLKALGSYFAMFTPATYITSAYAALCAANFFKHNKKYNNLNDELHETQNEDLMMSGVEKDFEPKQNKSAEECRNELEELRKNISEVQNEFENVELVQEPFESRMSK